MPASSRPKIERLPPEAGGERGPFPTAARILEAGERCVRRLGLQRVSIADVAAQAGVSRGSVYRYFPDRDSLVEAVLERSARRFVQSSEAGVARRRTLAAQVAEAAAFIRRHLRDEVLTLELPGESETLLATLLSSKVRGLLESWIEFWQPFLADAEARGEVRKGLDGREAAEWIVRLMMSFAVMPSAAVDLDDPEAVRAYVARYVVRGLA
ncbi:MAG TPA: TetR/AcrR family transcriptional regulator [Candidatus Binatia bacterium]|nr:TetR/AcrR family transcriptional regulator [Candidatus Binatia bacterium]